MPTIWQVVFTDNEKWTPWNWILKPGFRHVLALGYLPEHRLWLCYEVLFYRTEVSVLSGAIAGRILQAGENGGGVLSVSTPRGLRPSWRPRFGFWCVPAICHLLGLGCVAITPRGLHDFLLRNGAKPLLEDSDELRRERS